MTLSKMPSTTTLPTTSLKRLTLYKNQLAFTERTAKLTDGLKSANQRSFSLSVPDTTRELTMATLSTVVPGANVAVMVAHDEPGTSAQHKATHAGAELARHTSSVALVAAFLSKMMFHVL